jgi:uncharacterized membrane protein YedE/YeeE
MKNITTFTSGLLFGLGLITSGMTDPSKVLGFLDITGLWNPSLIFVMIGGIIISFFGFRYAKNLSKTIFNDEIHLPGTTNVTKELVIGGIIFGAGWSIAGFCPGPALVALGAGYNEAFVFVLAMIFGMLIHDKILRK